MDYKSSGVDIDAGNETVRRIKRLAQGHVHARRAVRHRLVRRPVQARHRRVEGAGAGLERRRRRHQAESRVHGESAPHDRRRSRQSLRQRHPRAGRDAAVLPRLPRHRPAVAGRGGADRRGAGARRARTTAARCSAARPRRCRASTPTANTTSPASSSAPSIARSIDRRPIDRGRRCR